MRGFDDISVAQLRRRRSAKWTTYPPDVLPAWVAEMDFPLAEPVRAALLDAIEHDDCGYANTAGLGESYARFVLQRFGWTLDPRGVFVVPDVLVGITSLLQTLTKPGDRIVVNSPVYPPFYRTVGEAQRQIEDVPLIRNDEGWELDFPALERAFAGGAAAYLLCSPHNPLGKVFARDTLTRIAELAKRYGVLVIADEIHAPLTMPGATFVPFLSDRRSARLRRRRAQLGLKGLEPARTQVRARDRRHGTHAQTAGDDRARECRQPRRHCVAGRVR